MKWIANNTVVTIRPFMPADQEALFKIAADTAFFGKPIEAYLDDRFIFLDLFYRYYTDLEPEHCWVAEANQEVVGFITGCTDSVSQQNKIKQIIVPQFLARLLRGKYRFGSKTWHYARRLWHAKRKKEFAYANPIKYPAHLHINIDHQWRGYGIGRRLIQIYLDQLIYENIPGVHLGTTSENKAACKLYERMGFQLLDARPSSQWRKLIDHPVENRTYGLLLPNRPQI